MLVDKSDNYLIKYSTLLIGIIIGIIFILTFFGSEINVNSNPKIKINLGSIIKDSHVYLFNKHIHHWFINLLILILIMVVEKYYNHPILTTIKGFNMVLIVHGLMYSDRFDFSK